MIHAPATPGDTTYIDTSGERGGHLCNTGVWLRSNTRAPLWHARAETHTRLNARIHRCVNESLSVRVLFFFLFSFFTVCQKCVCLSPQPAVRQTRSALGVQSAGNTVIKHHFEDEEVCNRQESGINTSAYSSGFANEVISPTSIVGINNKCKS